MGSQEGVPESVVRHFVDHAPCCRTPAFKPTLSKMQFLSLAGTTPAWRVKVFQFLDFASKLTLQLHALSGNSLRMTMP